MQEINKKGKQGNMKINAEFTQIGIQISQLDEVTQTLMYVCYWPKVEFTSFKRKSTKLLINPI